MTFFGEDGGRKGAPPVITVFFYVLTWCILSQALCLKQGNRDVCVGTGGGERGLWMFFFCAQAF